MNGEQKKEKQGEKQAMSRRQAEIEKLIQKRRQLKKHWKRADGEQREGISVLQAEVKKKRGAMLSKYCNIVWKRNLKMTSFMEDLKSAKTSPEVPLSQSKDPAVKNTAPPVKTGKTLRP